MIWVENNVIREVESMTTFNIRLSFFFFRYIELKWTAIAKANHYFAKDDWGMTTIPRDHEPLINPNHFENICNNLPIHNTGSWYSRTTKKRNDTGKY